MIFEGFSRVFSTVGDGQYETIGAFWDEMAARYSREALRGLGYNWTDTGIEYVIGLKEGTLPENAPLPEGACRKRIELPDEGWLRYTGRTEDLGRMYDAIYRDGRLDAEIETFRDDGSCELMIYRKP